MTLPPALKRIRHLSRELAADFGTRAARHDADRSAPTENMALLREAGLFGLAIPEQFGGGGHGLAGWAVAGEELAQGCASTALAFGGHVAATGMIMEDSAVPESAKRLVARLVIEQGKLIALPALDPTVPVITARPVAGGYRLYGKVVLAAMWEAADLAILRVRPEGQTTDQMMLVPTAGDGITVHDLWQPLGLRAMRSQTVILEGAFVAEEYVVSPQPITSAAWQIGAQTAALLGIGVGIQQLTRRILASLPASGEAERRMAQMACELDGARQALRHGVTLYGEKAAAVQRQFLMARYLTCTAVSNASRSSVAACGTRSLMQQIGLERMIRDAATAITQYPDEDQCLTQIGKLEAGGLGRPPYGEESRHHAAF